MGRNSAAATHPFTAFEQLRLAQSVLRQEAEAIQHLSKSLDEQFCTAVNIFYGCTGSVIVSGMGKAGLIGQKLVATLGSTGTRSHFLHPGEAVHGDLGRIGPNDCLLMLSFSGETEEIVRLLPILGQMEPSVSLVAMTGKRNSTLAQAARAVLDIHVQREACPLGLAPSTSTTNMLALGDALALVLSQMRGFKPEDFARFHPAGSLGQKLSHVEDWMRPLDRCRVALMSRTVRDVFVGASLPGRRTGAIMLTDADGKLTGIFTDSDLARLLESKQQDALDQTVSDRMTREPSTVTIGSRTAMAIEMFATRKISELPVVDEKGFPKGMIDITDIVHLLPNPSDVTVPEEDAGSKASTVPLTLPFPAAPTVRDQ